MAETLSKEEVEQRLENMQIWSHEMDRLVTRVEFSDYRNPVFFANAVFTLAEEEFHHPTVKVEYGVVEIDLWSHEEEGITEDDIHLAEKIEERLGKIDWD